MSNVAAATNEASGVAMNDMTPVTPERIAEREREELASFLLSQVDPALVLRALGLEINERTSNALASAIGGLADDMALMVEDRDGDRDDLAADEVITMTAMQRFVARARVLEALACEIGQGHALERLQGPVDHAPVSETRLKVVREGGDVSQVAR